MLVKTPFSTKIVSISKSPLSLAHSEINFCHVLRNSRAWVLQAKTVAIALIIAIHEYQHGQTFCYVIPGSQTYSERLRVFGYGNVGLHHAISVGSAIFREGSLGVTPLNFTSQLPQSRHFGDSLFVLGHEVAVEVSFDGRLCQSSLDGEDHPRKDPQLVVLGFWLDSIIERVVDQAQTFRRVGGEQVKKWNTVTVG